MMASTTSGSHTNIKHRQLCKNKNLKPNIGCRTLEVLVITGTGCSVYLNIPTLIQKFDGYSVLFLYAGNEIYLYFKPSDDMIDYMLNKRDVPLLNIEDVCNGDRGSNSKFIIYPVDEKVTVLECNDDCRKLYESLEKILMTKTVVSNVDIESLVRGSRRITVQCNDVDVSLKLRHKRTIRRIRSDVDNPLPKPPSLKDIESGELVHPYTEGHDLGKFSTQVSEEQNDETRTERVFSNTGSQLWVYPDSSAARFYLERKQTIGSNLLPTLTHRKPARHPDYSNYVDRLRTFQTWTATCPTPERMSQAGFFFTNQFDLVRCFQCGIGLKDFSVGDDPLTEHVRYSGHCSFLPELLGEQRLQEMKEKLQGSYPGYNHKIQHTGIEDGVTCFHCGGGLRSWEPNDDPWIEHCLWYPSCGYVRQKKGDEFIARAQSSSDRPNEVQNTAEKTESSPWQQQNFVASEKHVFHEQNKDACLEMGYTLEDYAEALKELRNRGIKDADLTSIIDAIEGLREKQGHSEQNVILHENQRLKNLVYCITCKKEEANVLFLPCTHHNYCMSCSAPLTYCPVCKKNIIEKIRTYMS